MLRLVWCGVLLAACSFEHGIAPAGDARDTGDARADTQDAYAGPTSATLFVADYGTGRVYRLALTMNTDPVITNTLALSGALSPIILSNGDLLVSELSNGKLDRYTTPLATPSANGSITGFGLGQSIAKLAYVDDELWVVNPSAGNVVRLESVAQGTISSPGSLSAMNGRGLAFDASRRRAYLTQCCTNNTLLELDVAADGTPTAALAFSGLGLSNPHGVMLTPWSELFVANLGGAISRFKLDTSGNPTPNGTISGSNLSGPLDMVLTPWGELFVSNLSNNMLSRFRFDGAHNAVPAGTFAMPPPGTSQTPQLAWMALVN